MRIEHYIFVASAGSSHFDTLISGRSTDLCKMTLARSAVRRALLYVPGSSQKMLNKTKGLTADCVAYDLEDSVTPSRKSEARMNVRRFLELPRSTNVRECAVRINAVGSGFEAEDLAQVVCHQISYKPCPRLGPCKD